MLKVLIVNDTDGRENIGCRLTSNHLKKALVEGLEATGRSAGILSAPWSFKSHPPTKLFNSALDPTTILSKDFLRELARVEYGHTAVDHAHLCDAVIFQPEGTISDGAPLAKIVRLFSLPLYCALHTEKQVVCTNGTFPLFEDDRYSFVKWALGQFDYVAARDRPTAEHYDVNFLPDEAFWGDRQACSSSEKDIRKVLVTTIAEARQEDNIQLIRAILAHCHKNELRPVILTKDAEVWSDHVEEIFRLGGSFAGFSELSDAAEVVAECSYHLGGRYHMAILAATCGVQSYLIRSNTHKNIWLTEELRGVHALPDNIQTLTSAELPSVPTSYLAEDVATLRNLQYTERARLIDALTDDRPADRTKHAPPARDLEGCDFTVLRPKVAEVWIDWLKSKAKTFL